MDTKNILNDFFWTDEDWKKYEQGTVELTLQEMYTLLNAVELVSNRNRLNAKQVKKWQEISKLFKGKYEAAIMQAMGGQSPAEEKGNV
jgi:hypothetical protein